MDINWFLLAPAAFFAGMVDAVVGGGGLIQIPVLLSQFSQTAIPTLFGTNKVSSIAGTGASLWRYARAVPIPWAVVLPATLAALVGAWLGAAVVAWLPREAMRPLVLVLMLAVAIYTFRRKDFGHSASRELVSADRWRGALLGLTIGFYDGFFGPGTGSFLTTALVALGGLGLVRAIANTKFLNLSTNVAGLLAMIAGGKVLWLLGAGMAAANVAGNLVGARLAIRYGGKGVRPLLVVMSFALTIKLLSDPKNPLWTLF